MDSLMKKNFRRLARNPYPGRGIVIGMDESGENMVQIYWIMGRSPNSRNRVFEAQLGLLRTSAADPAKVSDPSLIIYNAMRELGAHYIVSNGDQTDTIAQELVAGSEFRQALFTRSYEPDAPNYTPRIAGIVALRYSVPVGELSIIKRSPFGEGCDRAFFRYEQFAPGAGRCITTYMGDGDPLPSFEGEPYLVPIPGGDAAAVAQTFWNALNAENRVSLAAKFIEIKSKKTRIEIINQYAKQ